MSTPNQLRFMETDVVFESDKDEICESAIEDDDWSSDWEHSSGGSGSASLDEKVFQHVDSMPNLGSHQSQLTTLLHANNRYNSPRSPDSSSILPIQNPQHLSLDGFSPAMSFQSDKTLPLKMQDPEEVAQIHSSSTQPIPMAKQVETPKTVRRKMLTRELSVDLRQELIQEHKQSGNATLPSKHKQDGVPCLKRYREEAHVKNDEDEDEVDAKWCTYLFQQPSGYNSRGW